MKHINDEDGESTLECICGTQFDVSVFTEENMCLIKGVLHAQCPNCELIEGVIESFAMVSQRMERLKKKAEEIIITAKKLGID